MTRFRIPVSLVVFCVGVGLAGLSGCGPARSPAVARAPVPAQVAAPQLPEAIRWVGGSAEYQAVLRQTYRLATVAVEQAAASRRPGSWAVVLDADETVISNVTYQTERARAGLAFSAESWTAWVRRREATPLPGAAAFLDRVHALGGRIAIVTNRYETECEDTAAVFRQHRLAYDAMFCRPNGGPGDKNPRFARAAADLAAAGASPLDIVAVIGDNILDFPNLSQTLKGQDDAAYAAFGTRFFLVPNPMYGSWER
jgi:5'-nucleotidase (lipoprotein e(P4) family)